MKKLFLLVFLLFSIAVTAQDYIFEEDPIIDGRYNIIDDRGYIVGYWEHNYIDDDQIDIYDASGRFQGSVYQDSYSNQTQVYDDNGYSIGHTRKDVYDSNKENVYDKYGNLQGYYKVSEINNERVEFYDPRGNPKGYFEKNPITGDTEYIEY